jgi:preprotein translocase subunit SecG
MILATLLDISINLIIGVQVIVTLLLLLVVLMQRPKQEGLGAAFGAAVTDQAFGARTTDVLKKATVWLGTLFMLVAFVLCILLNKKYKAQQPTLSQEEIPAQVEQPQAQKSVSELIQEQEQSQK